MSVEDPGRAGGEGTPRRADPEAHDRKTILIVGDWVVDDNWVTGTHRSPTASRTGPEHSRALHNHKSDVQAFCGAGQTASLLHRAGDGKELFEITGIGLWSESDTRILEQMFEHDYTRGKTPLEIHRPDPPSPGVDRLRLFNIGPALGDVSFGTTRVLRVYEQTGRSLRQLNRIDWELAAPYTAGGLPSWISDRFDWNQIRDQDGNRFNPHEANPGADPGEDSVAAIVIKDLAKGVVSSAMIRKLKEWYSDKTWFVSTKAYWPEWLDELTDVDVRLLVVPDIAANLAVRSSRVTWWLSEKGHPSKEALDELKAFRDKFKRSNDLSVVVFPEKLQALGLDRCQGTEELVVQPIKESTHRQVSVRMASACYACLIANMLHSPTKRLHTLLGPALSDTAALMNADVERLRLTEGSSQDGPPPITIVSGTSSGAEGEIKPLDPQPWLEVEREWNQAYTSEGIIGLDHFEILRGLLATRTSELPKDPTFRRFLQVLERRQIVRLVGEEVEEGPRLQELFRAMRTALDDGMIVPIRPIEEGLVSLLRRFLDRNSWERIRHSGVTVVGYFRDALSAIGIPGSTVRPQIQLWRAMQEVDGYVCWERSRREKIRRLIRGIAGDGSQSRDHNVSALLLARPGSGKSFLVHRLAIALKRRFLSFDITQMASRLDLLDSFDAIMNASLSDPVLVFVDEINAPINGHHVFDAFLTVIDDGTYVRGSTRFRINPCVWVFAGTGSPTASGVETKWDDFLSRLTLGVFDLSETLSPEEHCLENVYVGASLIRAEFADVRFVEKGVLQLFRHIPASASLRAIRTMVKSFVNVQYGRVTHENLPIDHRIGGTTVGRILQNIRSPDRHMLVEIVDQ